MYLRPPALSTTMPSATGVATVGTSQQAARADHDHGVTGGEGGGSSTLVGLVDVDVDAPTDGQALAYDSATGTWVNAEPVAGPAGPTGPTGADRGGRDGRGDRGDRAARRRPGRPGRPARKGCRGRPVRKASKGSPARPGRPGRPVPRRPCPARPARRVTPANPAGRC